MKGWLEWSARCSGGSKRVVGQDAPAVVDDEELEPAREHGLAVGEQHLPAERHNVAAEAGGRGGAIADAFAPRTRSGRCKRELRARGISVRAVMAERVRRPERSDGGRALGRI